MKLTVLPKTRAGKWSLGLIIAMPCLIFAGSVLVQLYPNVPPAGTIQADLISRPGVGIPALAGMASGLLALITGLVAIIKHKERALLVYTAVAMGLLLVFFLAGEFFYPE